MSQGSGLEGYLESLQNDSAAPAGAGQMAQQYQQEASKPPPPGTSLADYLAGLGTGPDYQAGAQQWFSGANTEGTENGWSQDFQIAHAEQWDEAAEDGTLSRFFESPTATGVVTYDHTSSDGSTQYRFGDVYENGKLVTNVYDLHKDDPATANMKMLPWLTDGTTMGRLFDGETDPKAIAMKMDEFVRDTRDENNATFEQALQAMDQQKEIALTTTEWQEGSSDELLAGGGGAVGGAVTGGAAGATIGAFLGPGGAAAGGLIGGIGGALVGGFGGLANKDEIAEAAARAQEITELSNEEFGSRSAFTALHQWGGVATKLTSPLTNAAHGITDITQGEVGDGVSERYAVDDKGESTAPTWSKVADFTTTIGDSLMQFVSPINRAVYTAQVGGSIAGEAGQVATTGSMYDPRTGSFDNIFIDDDGNFDPVSASAGILKMTIDGVQLAGMRGLAASSERNARALAQRGGASEMDAAGKRFLLDETGALVSSRKTLSLLAPSEQIAYWTASRTARVAALKEGRAVSADDFYRAASSLATGSNKLKTAVTNAFGEAYEEGVQALLEPIALDGELDAGQVASAAAYGAASGYGMSLGATLRAPGSDERTMGQAYVLETLRNGVEPGWEEYKEQWATLTDTEKRIRATRTPGDIEATKSATQEIDRQNAATFVASEVDAAKALNARRKNVEQNLKSATGRTDAYHVMSGLLEIGRVSADTGARLGDMARAEAVEASARTITELLANRLEGMAIQETWLATEMAKLEATSPKFTEYEAMLANTSLSRVWGEGFVADLTAYVDAIYAETTDEANAYRLTRELNALLEGVFDRTAELTLPEGSTATMEELTDAAAHFVSLLQSREPKLDTGSYLAMLPRASWQLTRDGSDNFVMVNTDILQAINGDFDGDKLRAENQLVLSRERFIQARAGQNFGGVGREIDIAVRNYDRALTEALGKGLDENSTTQMRDAAQATLAAVMSAVQHRYSTLLSPEAWSRVTEEFETAVRSGNESARVDLLNALAREAGGAITDLGRKELNNEWLWISQIVRANFNQFQTEYRKLRVLERQHRGPSETGEVEAIDTPEGTQIRKTRASTDAQTLAFFAVGDTLYRKFQKIHYSFYNSRALSAAGAQHADELEMAEVYEEIARGVTRAEIAQLGLDDTVIGRVQVMLSRLVDSAMETEDIGEFDPAAAMTILANVKVKDVWFEGEAAVTDGKDLSLGQVLLKRALAADKQEHGATFAYDEKLQAKHARLGALTVPNAANGEVNAERAFIEIFKAVPFGSSLGDKTGALAMQTTPEQWLRNYISRDANGRQDLERFFTNVPEYLEREKTSNLPYSLDEMKRREVTAYRSMMDAMLAVGRHELTWNPDKKNPSKAIGGRIGKADKKARDDFKEMQGLVFRALGDFRGIHKGRKGDRTANAKLVQQMFEANPTQGRAILDSFPDAAANALYDFRDGELYVVPWFYEVLAEPDPEIALFQFWKNLRLAQWNATQVEGRQYHDLKSRFDRLMWRLAREPGQLHMEMLIRKMHDEKNLDEFHIWLNETPGFREDGEAIFVPFYDDVADFDSEASGGWSSIRAGADLREAISKGRRAAKELNRSLAFRKAAAATDRTILDGIKRAYNGDTQAEDHDRENLRKLEKALQVSHVLPRGFAPSAMLALTRGVVRSFDANSTDKGKTATSYEEVGEFQALMDAFGFVPGLERVMEVLTAHSIRSITTNLGDLSRTSGTAMEASGRQVEWQPLTIEQVIEMLDDPRTAPLAHALLIPSALDITPVGITERLLMDATLKDILDNDHYKDLFNTDSDNQLETDTRYLSVLDSYARNEGGHFDAIRAANDLAIVMTSGLKRQATAEDEDRLTATAYHHVAKVMRMVGHVLSSPTMHEAGVLDALRETVVTELRALRRSQAMPGFTDPDDGTVVESWVREFKSNLELEFQDISQQILSQYEGQDQARRLNAAKAEHRANLAQIDSLMVDDHLSVTVAKFELTGDPVTDAAKQARIVENAMADASFPNRVDAAAANAWVKLAGQRREGAPVDLDPQEWDALSRAVIGITMVDDVLRISNHISVPSLPKAPDEKTGGGDPALSDAPFHKYFDTTFSWIGTDLLTEGTPLSNAAVWLHTLAEQPRVDVSIDSLTRILKQTVLDRSNFGKWTPGLMSQLVEGQTRMDSAGAPPGIAAAGNGQKRWWAIAAATRRTGWVPPAELLTSATFTADYLAQTSHLFNEIPVTPTGTTTTTSMPIALLNNRFFASIKLDGVDVPLTNENVGFEWQGADEKNPYRYVALERLRPVVERFAANSGKSMADITVEVEFFHPDSQPVGTWNNAFFEGMSHSLLPDGSESLLGALWSDNGGQIALATQWTIDAGKKGLRALMPFRRPEAAALKAAQDLWLVDRDFAGMLRRKTELAVTYDDGSGAVGAEAYNAMYKAMKLQHVIVGKDSDGNPAVLTAEEVIAFQAANGRDAELPLDVSHSKTGGLTVLSPDVLRTVMGDTGDQGVARFFDDEYLLNPDSLTPYDGIDPGKLERFAWVDDQGRGHGWIAPTATIGESSLAHVSTPRTMKVHTVLSKKDRDARAERRQYLSKRNADAKARRYTRLDHGKVREDYAFVLKEAAASVGSERTQFDFGPLVGGAIAPRDLIQSTHTIRLLEQFTKVKDATGLERGWMIEDGGTTDYAMGVLNIESLNDERDAEHWMVKDDIALVKLNTFQKPERTPEAVEERVEEALRFLVNSGAYVVLGSGNGTGDLRDHSARYLKSLGYVSVYGSKHLYGPAEYTFQSQNERAYESTMRETRRIIPNRNAVTFLTTDPIGTDENSAALNPESTKLRTRVLVNNLVPSSYAANYNIPIEDNRDSGLYARTLQHLKGALDPANTAYRAELLTMAGQDPRGLMPIEDALNRYHARLLRTGMLEPAAGDTLEVGDIIPFLHPDGKVILYRHGFALPDQHKLHSLQQVGGMNIALAPSKVEKSATSNSGVIRDMTNRVNYGRQLLLEVPLQPHGDKIQLEWNGMKYVVVPWPDSYGRIPKVFANGTVVDLISDVDSADSKEAWRGRIRGYRNALAFYQFDFTNDLVKFFFDSVPSDKVFAVNRAQTLNMLRRLADQDQFRIPYADADALAKANVAVSDLLGAFAAAEFEQNGVPESWIDKLQADTEVEALIARAVITYLLTPGANLDNVLKSAGFSHPDALNDSVETREVPGLFAQLLDNGYDSPLHDELIRRFDSQHVREADGSGFKLHKDWTVEMFDGKGGSMLGFLQYGEAHSSGDNPVLDGQAFNASETGAVSAHNSMAANLSFGALTAHDSLEKSKKFLRSFTRTGEMSKFGDGGDSVWQMLTTLPNEKDASFASHRREMPAESVRRALARDEITGFYQPLNTTEWSKTEKEAAKYHRKALEVLRKRNLHSSQRVMVDSWVRMHLGRPHALDELGNERGVISFKDAWQALDAIGKNLDKGLLPVAGANVPLLDVNHLTTLYLTNLNLPEGKRWAPVMSLEENAPRAVTWDDWVEVAFGTAWVMPPDKKGIGPEPQFHQMYLLAIDGLMHGYQNATTSTRYLPVSSDALRSRLLMDPETNKMLVSISKDEITLATDPSLFNSSFADLEQIIAGERIYGPGRDGPEPGSALGHQQARIDKWHRDTGAPRQVNKKVRGVRSEGQTFLGYTTSTNALYRIMMNVRVGNTMFNFALALAAPLDAWYRRSVNSIANTLTGESTGGTGKAMTRLSERLGDGKIGTLAKAFGVETTWTSEQHGRIDELVFALSRLPEFKNMIYKEIAHHYPSEPGIGRIERGAEKFAKAGAKIQDPARGMPPQALARVYVESAIKNISRTPLGQKVYSMEQLLTQLPRNPDWLRTVDPEAHALGTAAIANQMSLKATPVSLAIRGFIEPLASSQKFGRNTTGNMLKIVLAFQNFWASFGTNITGMQGASDFMAFWLDGRQKKITARAQAALRGQPYNPEEPEYYDMTEALESLDLADAFIRGGVTHTALFALGMAAGSLGLSGEDDEMKFRRRQAELQGVPMFHDPRDIQADFRNKDSIYLNWLPLGMDSWFRMNPDDPNSPALAQMNWVTRTFLSPVIGMERFFNTGDFNEVIWGFKDALGAHPIMNQQLWSAASETAAELHAAAADAGEKGDTIEGASLLMSAVGVLSYMLTENQMANMIYIGLDDWDRNPYVLPKTDSDGDLQKDAQQLTRPNDSALQPFVNDDGSVGMGYLQPTEKRTELRALTENRLTLALIASALSGGMDDSTYWRYNMPVKTVEIDKPDMSQDEVELYVKAALSYQLSLTGQPNLTPEEIFPKVMGEMIELGDATGQFFSPDDVWKIARARSKDSGMLHMEILDDAGKKHLTTDGARAIFEGLRHGTFVMGDEETANIYIPWEMREQIAAEWSEELVVEGLKLGLDETKARSRMARIMGGPLTDPAVPGLREILFDNKISYDETLVYGQQNTSYVMGPDGRPWASNFRRDSLMGAVGLNPLKRMNPVAPGTTMDERGNTVDLVAGINTGLRGLVPFHESRYIPTDEEIGKAIEKAIEAAAAKQYSTPAPFDKKDSGSGSGWQDWGSGWRNFGSGGYGGGYSGGGSAYFNKMYSLPDNIAVYGNSMSFINSSNPILRRAFIRRERVSTERGRLNQWQ